MVVRCDQKLCIILSHNKSGTGTDLILSLIILSKQIIRAFSFCGTGNRYDRRHGLLCNAGHICRPDRCAGWCIGILHVIRGICDLLSSGNIDSQHLAGEITYPLKADSRNNTKQYGKTGTCRYLPATEKSLFAGCFVFLGRLRLSIGLLPVISRLLGTHGSPSATVISRCLILCIVWGFLRLCILTGGVLRCTCWWRIIIGVIVSGAGSLRLVISIGIAVNRTALLLPVRFYRISTFVHRISILSGILIGILCILIFFFHIV